MRLLFRDFRGYINRHREGALATAAIQQRFLDCFVVSLLAMTFVSVPNSARASDVYSVWQDPASKISLSYPDRWRVGLNQRVGDVLTIYAPHTMGRNDFASCRVRVSEDKRFQVYPRSYARGVQHAALAQDFWADYIGDYREVDVHSIYHDQGLGNGFASRAEVSFVTYGGAKVQKKGFIHASIYNGKLYALECSADRLVYDRWYASFAKILSSVKMRGEYSRFVGENYRDFANNDEAPLLVYGRSVAEIYSF